MIYHSILSDVVRLKIVSKLPSLIIIVYSIIFGYNQFIL